MLYPECDSNTSFRSWTKIAVSIVIAIAMITIALFSLSGCGGASAGSSSSGSPSSNTPEPAPVKTVDDYTWEELSEISAEISNETTEEGAIEIAKKYNLVNSDGALDGTQTKTIELTDGTTAVVQIAGFLHDDKTGGGKAGITFIFKGAITKRDMTSDEAYSGGWEGSQMRSWLATSGMSMLPQDLSSKIVAVGKKTNNTGKTESVTSVTVTSDKLWLFSVVELCGYAGDNVLAAEGSEYKLFRDCDVGLNSYSNNILIKSSDGSVWDWWERSPSTGLLYTFYGVNTEGDPIMGYDRLSFIGVVPGFCI